MKLNEKQRKKIYAYFQQFTENHTAESSVLEKVKVESLKK
jgi:hypothetical protein